MTCAIVIPIYRAYNEMHATEKHSFQQAIRVLKSRKFYIVHPKRLQADGYIEILNEYKIDFSTIAFPDRYFVSTISYSKLMLSPFFYKKFKMFQYILVYQTDAYVFEDKLDFWCGKGFSYVGAPWFKGFHPPECTDELIFVGNGGFSLRKVAHCLTALNSVSRIFSHKYIFRSQMAKTKNSTFKNLIVFARRVLFGNNTFWLFNDFHRYNNDRNSFQEDYFWGVICKEKFNWFLVPDPLEALSFSFEVQPEKMFAFNNNQLPMGCHAWNRYNPDFWKPYLGTFKTFNL
jgi:hypothetical protein